MDKKKIESQPENSLLNFDKISISRTPASGNTTPPLSSNTEKGRKRAIRSTNGYKTDHPEKNLLSIANRGRQPPCTLFKTNHSKKIKIESIFYQHNIDAQELDLITKLYDLPNDTKITVTAYIEEQDRIANVTIQKNNYQLLVLLLLVLL